MNHHIDFPKRRFETSGSFKNQKFALEKNIVRKNMNPEKKQKFEKMENLKVNTEIIKNE